jgi:hypothetical protein
MRPRRLGEILPAILAKLGVTAVELKSKGRTTSRDRTGQGAEQRLMSPWLFKAFDKSVALCRITNA